MPSIGSYRIHTETLSNNEKPFSRLAHAKQIPLLDNEPYAPTISNQQFSLDWCVVEPDRSLHLLGNHSVH